MWTVKRNPALLLLLQKFYSSPSQVNLKVCQQKQLLKQFKCTDSLWQATRRPYTFYLERRIRETYKKPGYKIPSCLCAHNSVRYHKAEATKLYNVLSFKNPRIRKYVSHLQQKYDSVSDVEIGKKSRELAKLRPLVLKATEYFEKENEMKELSDIIEEDSDPDLVEMALSDIDSIKETLKNLEEEVMSMLVPLDTIDETDIIIELSAGVGGQEAMLFTAEMVHMYENYSSYRGWQFDIVEYVESETGGVRRASAIISGQDVYRYMKFEGGVHRVQRVPKTERTGRTHTSTMTVSVLPQPTQIEIKIDPSKDLKIMTSLSSGPGGQHVNKTHSAVRILHIPTGIAVECQSTRSQLKNREFAMTALRSKLYEKEFQERQEVTLTQKKLQVGSAGRSEKIRTYNFQQDRVSDHRLGQNWNNIEAFTSGGEDLDDLIETLQDLNYKETVFEMLAQFEQSESCSSKASQGQ